MLLSFSCNNFKSFSDEACFSMVPEIRMKELEDSILSEKIGKKEEKALSVSVVYGPNAAGKTSIFNAMSCLKQILLQGYVRRRGDNNNNTNVNNQIIFAPFAFRNENKPVSFDISFVFQGIKYRYILGVYVGGFLEDNVKPYIDSERLYVNDNLVFNRRENEVEILELKGIVGYLNIGVTLEDTERTRQLMSSNIAPDSLLLMTDFNSFCSKKLVQQITLWFEEDFIILNSADGGGFFPTVLDEEKEGGIFIDSNINRIAQEAGIFGGKFGYVKDPETHIPKLVTVISKAGDNVAGIDADKIESLGTMRLVSLMPGIIMALENGATMVVDEFDASLHPMIVMNLISIFHNNTVNRKGAQLIFNTHNPIFLNHKLLRRDEIKFVERDADTRSSMLYALSDFKANGSVSVRKTSDYMKNYFINRYGAIVNTDFTDIIAEILREDKEDEKKH